jgi:hypothetical protein
MKEPVRLINRSGLTSTLLRAGTDERPTSARVRRAVSALGTAAAVGVVTGEAAGGASALAAGTAGAALAKAGAGSVSVLLAAKWVGIGSLGALLTIGAAELGSRAIPAVTAPAPRVEHHASSPPPLSPPGYAPRSTLDPSAPALDVATDEKNGATESVRAPQAREANVPTSVEGVAIAPRRSIEQGSRAAASPRSEKSPVLPSRDPLPPAPEGFAPPPVGAVPAPGVAMAQGDVLSPEDPPRAPFSLRLTKEVLLVDRAWGAVKRNDFTGALATLSDYERQFPELGLFPEVLFVRMEAQDRSGRAAEAKLEASRILALYPKSAQAERARSLLNRR